MMITTKSLVGQNMEEGFKLLDSGQYEEAEDYFHEILEKNSENKTANICFGRALGLSGSPAEALALFYQLSERHPGCLLYTSPSPRDRTRSRMPSSA